MGKEGYVEPDFRTLFAALPGLYMVLDPELRIVAASDAYLQATLTRREEIMGRHVFDVFPGHDDATAVPNALASFNRVLTTGQQDVQPLQRHDVRRPESEGGGFAVRYWSPVNTPVLNPDGSVAYIIHQVENVTDYVRIKEQGVEQDRETDALRERALRVEADLYARSREVADTSRKLKEANEVLGRLYQKARELDELKSRFFANVSHELRTPLTLILGPVDRMLAYGKLAKDVIRDLVIVQRNARALQRHVNDLLDIAKLEAGRMEIGYARVDLSRLVRLAASHFETLAADRRITFKVDGPPALAAELDVEKFERMVVNLLSNAFKFTPEDGAVTVRIEEREERALVRVQDTGPGVPENLREDIFTRFRQGESLAGPQQRGTGLGLAIVREFAQLHKGTVSVTDAPGGGSVFTLKLPLIAPPGTAVEAESNVPMTEAARAAVSELKEQPVSEVHPQPSQGRASRILIVEDNPDMNAFLADTLSRHYWVSRAYTGEDGLEKALADPPDLVLADVMLPGMTGDQMVEEMRRHTALDDVPIVMLTAKADDELRVRLLRQGVQDYLYKPFRVEELLARVDGLLAERQRAGRLLRQSEERYRTLFNAIDEGFCIIEVIFEGEKPVDYRFLQTNPAFEKQTGLAHVEGKRMRELIPTHEEHWFQTYGEIAVRRQPKRFEDSAERLGRWYDVYAFPFGRPEDRRVGVLFNDVSQRKQAEQDMKRLVASLERSNRELAQFAYVASHDLREPMRQVTAFVNLLEQTYSDVLDEAGRTYMDFIVEGATRMENLIRDLLLYSAIEAQEERHKLIPLELPLKEALSNLRASIDETHATITWDPLPAANVAPHQLAQVFQNLIANAIQFRGDKAAVIQISSLSEGSEWVISVADKGIGFDPRAKDKIFQLFQRLNPRKQYPGTGIGLTICKRVVEHHGGRIWAESEPGKGSVFYFTLPKNLEEPQTTQP